MVGCLKITPGKFAVQRDNTLFWLFVICAARPDLSTAGLNTVGSKAIKL